MTVEMKDTEERKRTSISGVVVPSRGHGIWKGPTKVKAIHRLEKVRFSVYLEYRVSNEVAVWRGE